MYANPYYETHQDDNSLEHYGVLGMKWGVRRYQNKDGTLTAAGKKRYAGDTPEQIERSERRKAKVVQGAKTAAKVAGKVAVTAAFALGMKEIAAASGLISAGSKAIQQLLNVQDGMTYRNIQSIDAQKLEQYLQTGTTNSWRNLQSESAQKFEQYLRKYAS